MTASGGGEHLGFIAIARSEATSRSLSLALTSTVNNPREERDLLGLAHAPDRCQRIKARSVRPPHDAVGDQGRAKGNFERKWVRRLGRRRLYRRDCQLRLLGGDFGTGRRRLMHVNFVDAGIQDITGVGRVGAAISSAIMSSSASSKA